MGERTEYMREYYQAHKEHIKAYNREYGRKNRERKRVLAREWVKAHPLESYEIRHRCYVKHIDARREYARNYYWRKKGERLNDTGSCLDLQRMQADVRRAQADA